MSVEAFRIQNFMGFTDSGWIELRPITLLFGRNSSGKSAILRALLLLNQSLVSKEQFGPLLFVSEDGFDLGGYQQIAHNHILNTELSFWFRCVIDSTTSSAVVKMVGGSCKIRLIYRYVDSFKQSELCGVDIYDENGGLVIQANASNKIGDGESAWTLESSIYDLQVELEQHHVTDEDLDMLNEDFALQPRIKIKDSLHLITRSGFFPQLDLIKSAGFAEIQLGQLFYDLKILMGYLKNKITYFLSQLAYLGPLRPEPSRFYYVAAQAGNSLAQSGQRFVRNYLDAQKASETNPDKKAQVDQINSWLEDSQLGAAVRIEPLDARKSLYEVQITDMQGDALTNNLREVGSGVSQVLPVITQALLSDEGSLAIVEQPELHLHPSAQAELGDLFISAAKRGVRFLIETHSEHVLLRIRRRIAESTIEKLSKTDSHYLTNSEVKILFIDKVQGVSSVETVDVNQIGEMSSPARFRGFFADDAREVALLTEARLQSKLGRAS